MKQTDGDDEPLFERIGAALRDPLPADAESEARLVARLRAEPASRAGVPGARRRWWLLRPRMFVVPPLVPLATAGVVAALLILWLRAERRPDAAIAPPAQFVAQSSKVDRQPVPFVCVAAQAAQVSVVGDFNDWNPRSSPLERAGRQGAWTGLLWLPPGVYEYAFVIDGRLQSADDARPAAPPDEFGVSNSVLIVGSESI
jgi:hypothetical protein